MNLSDKIRIRAGNGVATFHPYYDVLNQWADEAAKLEAENEALRDFLRQVKAMLTERYQPHVIARQIDALLKETD